MKRLNPWNASDLEHGLSRQVADLLGTEGLPPQIQPFRQWWLDTCRPRPLVTWEHPGEPFHGDATMDAVLVDLACARRADASWERLRLVRVTLRHKDAAQRVVTVPGAPDLSASLTDLLVQVARVVWGGRPSGGAGVGGATCL